jgi:hypothetical protein
LFSDDEGQEVVKNENVEAFNEYEELRARNIVRNNGIMAELGLQPNSLSRDVQDHNKRKVKVCISLIRFSMTLIPSKSKRGVNQLTPFPKPIKHDDHSPALPTPFPVIVLRRKVLRKRKRTATWYHVEASVQFKVFFSKFIIISLLNVSNGNSGKGKETALLSLRTPKKKSPSSNSVVKRGKFESFLAAGTPSRENSFATPAVRDSSNPSSASASSSSSLVPARTTNQTSGGFILDV